MSNNNHGILQPFTLDNINVRGKLLQLSELTQHIATLKEQHTFLASALSEMLAASAVLAFDLKTASDITLQIHSPGQIPLLLAQCSQNGTMRAFAETETENRIRDLKYKDLQVKDSVFAVTVTQNGKPYQSLVALDGLSVSHSLEQYFSTSVQLPTYFKVFTSQHNGEWGCGALFLQAMPGEKPVEQDDWHRLGLLLGTIATEEIGPHGDSPTTMLQKLFHEDELRVFEPVELNFPTESTRERMAKAILSIGQQQAEELLAEGPIVMTCEFTGAEEKFDAVDVAALFKTS